MESRFVTLLGVVLAATLLPSAFAGCSVDSKSDKFTAPQQGIGQGTYQWQLSPCKAETFSGCSSKYFIVQFTSDGQCDTNNLVCGQAPTKETKTSSGYTLNYFCGNNQANGEKDAVVNVKCTKGPLKLVSSGVTVTNPDPNFAKKYLYTFNVEGGCGGFDGGWIFVIIVLVGLFLYFVGGFAFNFFVRKLRGVEAIPNVTFWKDLPYLVKDGFMFVFGRFCGRGGFSTVK